jgi:hypothetical protein
MKTPLLALLAAATVALAANTSTNNKKPSGPTPPGGNKTAATEKKPKKDAKAEAPVAEPEAAAEPVSLMPQTIDATTQMALTAAKAAQEEVAKLAAIGTGQAAGAVSNAKLAEAAVATGTAVAKELSKPKQEGEGEAKPEGKKPEAKKPETKSEPKAEKKPAGEKPKKAAGA